MNRKEFLGLTGLALLDTVCSKGGKGDPADDGLIEPGPASGLKVTTRLYDLKLKHSWGLSRGTWTTRRNCYVRIEAEGLFGWGEAAPIARYGESAEGAQSFIKRCGPILEKGLREYAERWRELEAATPGEHAGKAALDMAILDWLGKRLGTPLWRLQGLDKKKAGSTTFSIGIDEVPVMQEKVREAIGFECYKIKVGTPNDRKIIEGIREVTSKPLRVDANEGWKTKEEALEMMNWMAGMGVELVEQPLPADRLAECAWLKERSRIPIFADESLMKASDIPAIAPYFNGINIKLMKCGRHPGGGPDGRDRAGPWG
jgi:L-alanine-DL-glutamate epimerase and related enzymes of enolase superfamily